MKNIKLNLFLFIIIYFLNVESLISQVNPEWVKYYTPTSGASAENANDVTTDPNGNVYVTGVSSKGYSANDMVTIKYNSAGVFQWQKSYFFPGGENYNEVGKFITSYQSGAQTFIYAAGDISYTNTALLVLAKYDTLGNQIWVKTFSFTLPGSYDNIFKKMITDSVGNCYLTGGNQISSFVAKFDASGIGIFSSTFPNPPGYYSGKGNDVQYDNSGNVFVGGQITITATSGIAYLLLKYNPTGVLQWSKTYNYSPGSIDIVKDIVIGNSGNIYLTGESNLDIFTMKYNTNGDTVWTKRYNGNLSISDYGRKLTLDNNENVYVTGTTDWNGADGGDIVTIKYDSAGSQQWTKKYKNAGNLRDDPKEIKFANSNNIYVTGYSSFGVSEKYVTIKYNLNGDSLWTREYDFAVNDFEEPNAMVIDYSGNVIVAGVSGYYAASSGDFGTIKYNSSGVLQWAKKYTGAQSSDDRVNNIAKDKNGNIYVAGKAFTSGAGENIVVIKYNSAGVQKWVHNAGGGGYNTYDEAKAITVDDNGFVYYTGTTDFSFVNKRDIITRKLDSNGTVLWTKTYNGSGNGDDEGLDIVTDATGNVYVGGNETRLGQSTNYVVIKYNSSSIQQWASTYNGTANDSDKLSDLDVDVSGNVYVTGSSIETTTSNDATTIKFNSSGNQLWIIKFNHIGNEKDYGTGIKADKNGNVYICANTLYNSGGSNGYMIKYDSTGTYSLTTPIIVGSLSASTRLYSIATDKKTNRKVASGSFITNSSYNCLVNLPQDSTDHGSAGLSYYENYDNEEVKTSSITLDSNGYAYIAATINSLTGGTNIFIQKIGLNAGSLSKSLFNGTGNSNDGIVGKNSIAVTDNGEIFVGGYSYDSLYGNVMTTIKYKFPYAHLFTYLTLQGAYTVNYSYSDTISVCLRNTLPPYNIADSCRAMSNSFVNTSYFTNISDNIPYYLVIKHRNSIETWSSTGITFSNGEAMYDFRDIASKAYGSNLVHIGNQFSLYSGDVNQDGVIDLTDITLVFNSAGNFINGYVVTDVTGDNVVDLTDLTLVFNNASNFVGVMKP